MALPFSLFLALKYIKPRRTFLSVVTLLSVMGVMIGVGVLIIVLSVMTGFDDVWRDKILSFNAHITVVPYVDVTGKESDLCELMSEIPDVTGAAPSIQSLIFVQKPNGQIETPFIRGIDPDLERDVSRVPQHIIAGEYSVDDGGVMIGVDLAHRLGVWVGDTITVYSPATFMSEDEIKLPAEMRINGIFDVGMWEFDVGFVLASIWETREFCDRAGVISFQVMTRDPFHATPAAEKLAARLGPQFQVDTWMTLNQQLFDVLRVEKNMMFFLLLFITLVAAFGITITLITMTVQKTREIGLLRSLGFSAGNIMHVFFWQGWLNGVLGTILGFAFGLLALKYRNNILGFLNNRGMELFPKKLYLVAEIPAVTTAHDLIVVAVAVLIICTLAAVIPAWQAARLDPVRALRNDG